MAPQIIFGTSTLGMDGSALQDANSVKFLLQTLRGLGITRLDTAARYPPRNLGRAEELLGEARELSHDFVIDTKVYTDTKKKDGSGDLTRNAISKSVGESLERLQRPKGVNVLYAHRADPSTPLNEQIQGFMGQITTSHCKAWGVSNVPPKMLEEMLELCEKKGWPKPSYYQGTYNVISRGMETKLWPILQAHNIKFVAFWVLATGFLTGKFVNGEHAGTRMGDDNPLGKKMQEMYGSEDVLNAVKEFDTGAKALDLTPLEVAVRWTFHNSILTDDDCVLLGASKVEQITETAGFVQKGPLSSKECELVEKLWESVKESRGDVM
ncbi:putative oxidoreductase [Nemania abortiva]|nr:putative oxidoreductase [Nemania abortiva]